MRSFAESCRGVCLTVQRLGLPSAHAVERDTTAMSLISRLFLLSMLRFFQSHAFLYTTGYVGWWFAKLVWPRVSGQRGSAELLCVFPPATYRFANETNEHRLISKATYRECVRQTNIYT